MSLGRSGRRRSAVSKTRYTPSSWTSSRTGLSARCWKICSSASGRSGSAWRARRRIYGGGRSYMYRQTTTRGQTTSPTVAIPRPSSNPVTDNTATHTTRRLRARADLPLVRPRSPVPSLRSFLRKMIPIPFPNRRISRVGTVSRKGLAPAPRRLYNPSTRPVVAGVALARDASALMRFLTLPSLRPSPRGHLRPRTPYLAGSECVRRRGNRRLPLKWTSRTSSRRRVRRSSVLRYRLGSLARYPQMRCLE